jgi:putative ABC transport system permease protein
MLAKNSGFTAVAVLTLALGIGANSTIFSWINSTLLNPIPGVARSSEIISLTRGERENPTPPFSYLDYRDLRDANRSFSGLLAFHMNSFGLTGVGEPVRVWGELVSANYFDVLAVRPVLGRGFLPREEQKPSGAPVVVLSYGLWQRQFGGDPAIIGKTISINKYLLTVVGVAPRDFQGAMPGLRSDLWAPLMMDLMSSGDWRLPRDSPWLNVFGKLRPQVGLRQAQEEMNLLMHHIVEEYPDAHRGPNDIALDPLWRSPFGASGYLCALLPMLMAIAGVVLLLASANVANLLLVRSVARRREFAIRLSVGASRWRLVRQLLVESFLLALAGGSIAMLVTTWTCGMFADLIPSAALFATPISFDLRADRTVFLATLAISALTSVVFGILPALRASSLAPVTVLKEETGSASGTLRKARLSNALVVAQIALSLLLLISAGLFIRSLKAAQRFDPGFDPNHVLLASYDLAPVGYSDAQGIAFDQQLLAKVQSLPGVQSATLADWLPLGYNKKSTTLELEGYVSQPHELLDINLARVAPNYLGMMRIPLVAGRDFTLEDTEKSQPVAVVNQALADRYWPKEEALGKRVHAESNWYTVVGVARNSKVHRLNEPPQPLLYLPLFQDFDREDTTLQARVSGDPMAFTTAVENAVHELNSDLPLFGVTTLRSQAEIASTAERIVATLAGAFGLLALVLAAVGIYGVISYTTRQRVHEIGIRMALGAERNDVLLLVLRQGVPLTLIGLAVGLGASMLLTRLVRSKLFGVTATDPLTFAGVTVLLCAVALLACYIPARRATKVDPMVALRHE